MSTVYLFHGFNVRDGGAGTVDRLRPYLEIVGHRVVEVDYLWTGLLGVRLCNRKIASAVASLVEPGSVAVGHSNGCALIHHAAFEFGAPFRRVAYINPALDEDATLAAQVETAHVYHSPGDLAVRAASWLPNHAWGRMGAEGYVGIDKRYHNHIISAGRLSQKRHSEVFGEGHLRYFGPRIVADVGGDGVA